jgi:predicted alpha/beta superfamily hydrolase
MTVAIQVLRAPFHTVEETRMFQIPGHPFPHEVRVALPSTYADSDRAYPVLWVTDNALEAALAVVGNRELIIVSVGGRPEDPVLKPDNGRVYDFYSEEYIGTANPVGDRAAIEARLSVPALRGGGAVAFRDFLIDDVRAALAADYRMDPADHALAGYSAGGWFTAFAMFTRPDGFARYVSGAPVLNFCRGLIWRIEEDYAAAHDDLDAELFLVCGDLEMLETPGLECLSSMTAMIERLSIRKYPSLRLGYRILTGETHESGYPLVLSAAVRAFWPARA